MKRFTLFFIKTIILSGYLSAQICGCTDPLATNYNSVADTNDGSCIYDSISINPVSAYTLDNILNGTSGMIFWEGGFWTFNDHLNLNLYKLDSTTGVIIDSIRIAETGNYDTEEISQDADYLYFGDFGNNSGSRTDLRILKISKAGLLANNFTIDTIFFNYADQTDFTPASMNTDYDCEAFIVTADSIYLFTKQWVTNGTAQYVLPKTAGYHVAHKRDTCAVGGLITGATYIPEKQLIVLCGYNNALAPFFFLLYDFPDDLFFSGNKRKINIDLIGHQVEAIATTDALHYYVTNEYFQYSMLTTQPKLQKFDLSAYLSNYLLDTIILTEACDLPPLTIYPNPATNYLSLKPFEPFWGMDYFICSNSGQVISKGKITQNEIVLPATQMSKGSYILTIKNGNKKYTVIFFKQ
ncbi:MAG TPA: T9SS type A sorting domain-containing protein [Bacteroidales bacterium]|nr:T9SS type A sorting domain-containing protein [Bacteroidales bacterium]